MKKTITKLLTIIAVVTFCTITAGKTFAFAFDTFDKYGKWLPWLTDNSWGGSGQMVITQTPLNHYYYGSYPLAPYLSTNFARNGGDGYTIGIPVLAISDGVVVTAAYQANGWGNYVILDHQNGYKTLYAHMNMLVLNGGDIGKTIRRGQEIGTIGNTGNVSGANLEFGMQNGAATFVDPMADGRAFHGSISVSQNFPSYVSPVISFEHDHAFVYSDNDIRPNDPTNPWDPPVIDPLDRYLQNYGYIFPSGMIAEPVNTALGSFVNRNTDLSFNEGTGPAFNFERFYNSPDQFIGTTGEGWDNSFNIKIMANANNQYSVKLADGRGETFQEPDSDPTTFNGSFNKITPESTGTLNRYDGNNGYKFYYTTQDKTVYTFNSDKTGNHWGKIESITDISGKSIHFAYDANGNLSTANDDFGNSMAFSFGADKLLDGITTSDGRAVNYNYNFDGKLSDVTKPNGADFEYTYDADNRITSITDAAAKTYVSNTYDVSGRVITQTDGNGGVTKFSYAPETGLLGIQTGNQSTKITDPKGNVTTQINNPQKYLIKEVKANGETTNYDYNAQGKVIKKSMPDGTNYLYSYDSNGNMLTESDPNGLNKTNTYNSQNLPIQTTDQSGAVNITYNAAGKILTSTDQNGKVKTNTYDANNLLISSTDENSNVTVYTYTARGLIQTQKDIASGSILTYQYDAIGNRIKVTDAQGSATNFQYDTLGNVVKSIDPNGKVKTFEYDGNGNLTAQVDEAGVRTEYKSDGNENITEINTNVPTTQTVTYSVKGDGDIANQDGSNLDIYSLQKKNESWIGTGSDINKSYLALDLHGNSQIPQGSTILSAKLVLLNNHSGHGEKWQWISVAFDLYAEKSLTPAKFSATTPLPSQRALTTAKDSLKTDDKWLKNSLWNINATDPIQDLVNQGLAGNDISIVAKGTGTKWGRKFFYNYRKHCNGYKPQLVIQYTNSKTVIKKETNQYDANNNKIVHTDPNGNVTKYTYDNINRLTKEDDYNSTNVLLSSKSYAYNSLDQKISEIDGNGNQTQYNYDKAGNVIKITNPCIGLLCQGTRAASFEYDVLGRQTKAIDFNGNATTYQYDAKGRKVKETDALGNVTSYTYDNDGNLITQTDAKGSVSIFTYDSRNKLTSIQNAKGAKSQYTYDLLGNLAKQINFAGEATTFAYDGNGNLLKQTDNLGQSTNYEYDSRNNLTKITDAKGNVSTYGYDQLQNKVKEINPDGTSKAMEYDPNGNLVKMTGEDGTNVQIKYDGLNRKTAEIDQKGSQTKYAYDKDGNVINVTDKLGNITTVKYNFKNQVVEKDDAIGSAQKFEYDSNGNLTKLTDNLGTVTTYKYDALNRNVETANALGNKQTTSYDQLSEVTSQTDLKGNLTKYEYDALGNLTKATDRAGNATSKTYDSGNRITSTVNPAGLSETYSYDSLGRVIKDTVGGTNTTTYAYDANSNIVNAINSNGVATSSFYDSLNRKISTTNPSGTTSQQYDSLGRVIKTIDQKGNTTANLFDAVGNLISQTDATGAVSKYEYDVQGNLTKTIDANGNATSYQYNKLNLKIKEINPGANTGDPVRTTNYEYDRNGNIVKAVDPKGGATKFTYDIIGNLTTQTDVLGSQVKYIYDQNSNLINKTDKLGNQTAYQFDNMDRLTKVTDALGAQTNYSYDATGNLTNETNANGKTTTRTYDVFGRLSKETNPLNQSTAYQYDSLGNLVTMTKPDSSTVNYTYDNLNRLTLTNYGSASENVSYSYDALGNLTKVTKGNNSNEFIYNQNNQVITAKDSTSGTEYDLTYEYDAVGNRTQINYPDNSAVQYSYSPANLVSSLKINNSQTAFKYDANGNLLSQVNPDGSKIVKAYDAANQLTAITNSVPVKTGNTTVDTTTASYKYTLDKNGNRTLENYQLNLNNKIQAGTTANSFDKDGRLTKSIETSPIKNGTQTEEFAYDSAGNRTTQKITTANNVVNTTNYSYNDANQLIEDSQNTYLYDAMGQRVSKRGKDGNSFVNMYYDNAGNLTSENSQISGKTSNVNYLYDGLNRRTEKDIVSTNNNYYNKVDSVQYIYDGKSWDNLSEYIKGQNDGPVNSYLANVDGSGKPTLIATDSSKLKIKTPAVVNPVPQNPAPVVQQPVSFPSSYPVSYPDNTATAQVPVSIPVSAPVINTPIDNNLYEEGINDSGAYENALGNGGLSYYMRDGLGSNVGIFGNKTINDYSAYGTMKNGSYSIANDNTYSGEIYDPETQMYYYGSRYYDAANGTWNKEDSYRGQTNNPGSRNRYSFVENDPVNNVDLYGFSSLSQTQSAVNQSINTINSTVNTYQSQVSSINSMIPSLASNINATYWDAHHALETEYLYIGMNGIIGRLQARGYSMNYGQVYNYLGGQIAEKASIYNYKQNQYYGALNDYNSALTVQRVLNGAISSSIGVLKTLNTMASGLNIMQQYDLAYAQAMNAQTPLQQFGNAFSQGWQTGLNFISNSPVGLLFGMQVGSLNWGANFAIGVVEVALAANPLTWPVRVMGYMNGTGDPAYQAFNQVRNVKTNIINSIYGVGNEDYYNDGTTVIDNIFPGGSNFGNITSDKYNWMQKGYLIGTTAGDVADIVLTVDTGVKVVGGIKNWVAGAQVVENSTESINITEKSIQHINESHIDLSTFPNKSKFYGSIDVYDLIRQSETVQPIARESGVLVRSLDAGQIIGVDRYTGQATSIVTVITDSENNLLTTYPGNPKN